jgi:RHS repeat-associated protein
VDDNNNGTLDDPSEVDRRYTYDDNGSTTSVTSGPPGSQIVERYVWDLRNRMVGYDANGDNDTKDNGDANYAYDVQGNRIRKQVVGTGSTVYLVDPQNPTGYAKAIEERSTPTGAPVRSYILGLDVIGQSDSTNGTLYLMKDGHRTTRGLVDSSGNIVQRYDFDGFGNKVKFVHSSGTDLSGDPLTTWLMPDGYRDFATSFDRTERRDVNGRSGRMLSVDPRGNVLGDTLNSNLYVYASGNPIYYTDPTGHWSYTGLAVTAGITALLGGILLPAIPAAYNKALYGNPFFHGWKRNLDDFYAYMPWFVYDSDDYIFPSTPSGIIRAHKNDFTTMETKYGVPKVLLATVLLTELRHYNVFDTLTDYSRNASVGITQIRPDTVLKHAATRPDLYPSNLTTDSAYALLKQPYSAIDLLAREIKYQAETYNVPLSAWTTGDENMRRQMIIGFVSAKDTDSYNNDTQFGSIWGIESYEMILKNRMLD